MVQAQNRTTINRQINDVFNYLAAGENNQHWRDGVLSISRTSPTAGQGAAYRQILKGPGGRKIDGDYEVTEYDPPRLLAFQVTAGPARPKGKFTLSVPRAGQTEVIFELEFVPTGVMRLMKSMVAKQMNSEVQALQTLKKVLEDHPNA